MPVDAGSLERMHARRSESTVVILRTTTTNLDPLSYRIGTVFSRHKVAFIFRYFDSYRDIAMCGCT